MLKKVVALFLVLVFAATLVSCSEPPEKKSKGVIKKVDLSSNLITIERNKKVRKFHLTEETKYFEGEKEVKSDALKPMAKVKVIYQIKNKKRMVKQITIVGMSAKKVSQAGKVALSQKAGAAKKEKAEDKE